MKSAIFASFIHLLFCGGISEISKISEIGKETNPGSIPNNDRKTRRKPDAVSRYIREFEAAVSAAGYVLNASK